MMTSSDYWNQVLRKILSSPMPSKDLPDPIKYSNAKAHTRKRLLLLDIMAASTKDVRVPNIYLRVERVINMKPRKARGKDGMLNICKLSDFEL